MEYKILLVDSRQPVIDEFTKIDWGENFSVEICSSGQEGLSFLNEIGVQLVYLADQLPDMDAAQFINRKNQHPKIAYIPVTILSEEQNYRNRIEQMVEGADDYMILPFEPQELQSKARILLRELLNISGSFPKSERGFSGTLNEMNLFDLLQTMELGRKSGVIHLQRDTDEAFVYVQEGMVFDAENGGSYGEDTLFHLFTWTYGRFNVTFGTIERERKIQITSEELNVKGMKALEAWQTILNNFSSLDIIFQLNRDIEPAEMTENWKKVLPLIDGVRSLRQILKVSPLPDTETLTVIQELQAHDCLQELTSSVEEELLIFGEFPSNGNYQIDSEKLKKTIKSYIETFVSPGKNSKKRSEEPVPSDSTSTKPGPKVLFNKVELQYIKRKLL